MDKINNCVLIIIIFALCVGCAVKSTPLDKSEKTESVEIPIKIFQSDPADEQIFEEALKYLSNDQKSPNYNEAKIRLEYIVRKYPDSKWAEAAEGIIKCIEKISDLEARIIKEKKKAQGQQNKYLREIESIKEDKGALEEKYSAESNRLQKENERLKKDIMNLKNLEIQLEKREKMLR